MQKKYVQIKWDTYKEPLKNRKSGCKADLGCLEFGSMESFYYRHKSNSFYISVDYSATYEVISCFSNMNDTKLMRMISTRA
jgi:hypothetical protein